MEPLDDETVTLIENAQKGKDAFEQLVRRYQHDVFRIIRVYTQNDSDAEDLSQETWIKVYQSLGNLKKLDRFENWLFTIAVNTAKNWLKSRAYKKSQATDEMQPQQLWGSAVIQYQRQRMIEEIRDAIDSLSVKNREVVLDFYILGYSTAQISQQLNIPQSTVTGRLQEARKQLRKEFETMVAQSAIREKFAPDSLVRNVMDKVASLPTSSAPTGNIIQRIGRIFTQSTLLTTGIATLIVFTVIGLIISNLQHNGDVNQKDTSNFGDRVLRMRVNMPIPPLNAPAPAPRQTPAAEGAWVEKADMPTPRGTGTVAVNGKIYAIGGIADGNVLGLSTMEVYDPATDTWTKKADMPTPRFIYGPSAVNGKIYAIGGWVRWGNQKTSTVEEYGIAADTWTKKTDMPTSRSHLSTSVVNGKIYAVGGRVGPNITLSTVEMYDPVTDTWIKKAGMPIPRMGLSTSVVDGKIYAIGGRTADAGVDLSTVEAYDPTTDTWTRKADMPTPRSDLATCVVDGKIYAIGGDTDMFRGPGYSTVEVYNPAKDEWTKDTDLPFGIRSPGASAVNGKIYVIGGAPIWPPPGLCLSTVLEYDTGFRITPVALQGKKAATWGKLKHSR